MAIIQDSTGAYTWAIDSSGVASVKIISQVFPTTLSNNLTAAATTNAALVKNAAGSLYCITATNYSASIKYLKIYNLNTAPTVGTSVPIFTIPLPAASFFSQNFGSTGLRFTTGISFAITGAMEDKDTTALVAGDVKVKIDYI